jgi:hypothetical protein
MNNISFDDAIVNAIPIYTRKKPNPKSGNEDCPITKREKEHFRNVMKIKLNAAKTEKEQQDIIEHYKQLFSE